MDFSGSKQKVQTTNCGSVFLVQGAEKSKIKNSVFIIVYGHHRIQAKSYDKHTL